MARRKGANRINSQMTKAPKLKKEDGLIDWGRKARCRWATKSGQCSRGPLLTRSYGDRGSRLYE